MVSYAVKGLRGLSLIRQLVAFATMVELMSAADWSSSVA